MPRVGRVEVQKTKNRPRISSTLQVYSTFPASPGSDAAVLSISFCFNNIKLSSSLLYKAISYSYTSHVLIVICAVSLAGCICGSLSTL